MRFSTRTAFVFTLFAGLVAAAIGLSVSRSHLQNTINELQNLHGILVDENEEDRVELTSIGPGLPFKYGAQLFRVENYRDYDLEVSFVFTSWPETTEKQIVRLNSPHNTHCHTMNAVDSSAFNQLLDRIMATNIE